MAIQVGIVGLGMMGTTHFKGYRAIPGADVVALCDVSGQKLSGDWSNAAGNIDTGAAQQTDLAGLRLYTSLPRLLRDKDVDLVDLCVPTFQHASMTIKALKAGKHVFCEKPMAITSRKAKRMIETARACGRMLAIGHVLRFWPEYVLIREMIADGRYGRVTSAVFTRLSARPLWSWDNWLQDPARSGAAALDLHIHDTDTVQWYFGRPEKVSAVGTFEGDGLAHVVTTYHYADGPVIVAEGGWDYPPSFPFRMAASIVFERAAVEYSTLASPTLTIHEAGAAQPTHPPVPAQDGYTEELRYFVECVAAGRPPERIDPAEALAAVAIVEAEIKAARTGRPVKVRL